MAKRQWLVAALAGWLVTGAVPPATAAPLNFADHLGCYKVDDTAAKQSYTADVVSNELAVQFGCVVKTRAKLFCVGSAKQGISPPAFPAAPGTNIVGSLFLCYKLTCGDHRTELRLNDQLGGTRVVRVGKAKMLCVPAKQVP